ncbi:DUF6053 domain-containing protein [Lysobacter enzymogenes]
MLQAVVGGPSGPTLSGQVAAI